MSMRSQFDVQVLLATCNGKWYVECAYAQLQSYCGIKRSIILQRALSTKNSLSSRTPSLRRLELKTIHNLVHKWFWFQVDATNSPSPAYRVVPCICVLHMPCPEDITQNMVGRQKGRNKHDKPDKWEQKDDWIIGLYYLKNRLIYSPEYRDRRSHCGWECLLQSKWHRGVQGLRVMCQVPIKKHNCDSCYIQLCIRRLSAFELNLVCEGLRHPQALALVPSLSCITPTPSHGTSLSLSPRIDLQIVWAYCRMRGGSQETWMNTVKNQRGKGFVTHALILIFAMPCVASHACTSFITCVGEGWICDWEQCDS
jgi:hypothetical protein